MKRTLRNAVVSAALVALGVVTTAACSADDKSAVTIPGTNGMCTQSVISGIAGELDAKCTYNGVTLEHNNNGTVLTGEPSQLPENCDLSEAKFTKQGNQQTLNGSITCTWGNIPVTFDKNGAYPGQTAPPAVPAN